ncbi:MAG: NAD+ synthase [Firmicutes bacterium]|nr:NAD+ synthase [Bacillota bacterium]
MKKLRLSLAQINPVMGDIAGNSKKILQYIDDAKKLAADIVVFPELSLCGYPPEDLLFNHKFVEDNLDHLKNIAKKVKGITVVLGFVDKANDDIYDAAAVIHEGKIAGIYHKIFLPNYGVFDEKRYFRPGSELPVFVLKGITFGVNICEDIWFQDGPAAPQSLYGKVEVIITTNASPYHVQKWKLRKKMLAERAAENSVFIAYCNTVGGQDELVFDGLSMVVNPKGELLSLGKPFEEDLLTNDINVVESLQARLRNPMRRNKKIEGLWDEKNIKRIVLSEEPLKQNKPRIKKREINFPGYSEEVYKSIVSGTGDYVKKNGFKKVVIGISGGIDSALTSAIAVDAVGKENVAGVFMPSRYSSDSSRTDAEIVCKNLGIKLMTIPIEPVFKRYLESLSIAFKGLKPDITEENIQARIRGNILMALSNKFGWLVLTTGNKSEMAVGYATLYGDMAGGFAVIKDVPKTLVYELANYRNSISEVFPPGIFTKAPTAELRENQKDQDSLPPYEILDPILKAYIEEDRSPEEISAMGFDAGIVKKVINMIDRSEYKRRQSPPGIKITPRAFGKDRRLPITNRYKVYE